MSWNQPPTKKQLEYIEDLQEYAYEAPVFKGSTRREASDYIDKWSKVMRDEYGAYMEFLHGDYGDRSDY